MSKNSLDSISKALTVATKIGSLVQKASVLKKSREKSFSDKELDNYVEQLAEDRFQKKIEEFTSFRVYRKY